MLISKKKTTRPPKKEEEKGIATTVTLKRSATKGRKRKNEIAKVVCLQEKNPEPFTRLRVKPKCNEELLAFGN